MEKATGTGWAVSSQSPRSTCRGDGRPSGRGYTSSRVLLLTLATNSFHWATRWAGTAQVTLGVSAYWNLAGISECLVQLHSAKLHTVPSSCPFSTAAGICLPQKTDHSQGPALFTCLRRYPQKWKKAGRDFIVSVTAGFVSLAGKGN